MNVEQILKRKGYEIHSASPETRLPEAIKMMVENSCGSLLILNNKQLMGIITERDILWTANVHIHDFGKIKVSDIMSDKVITCTRDCSVEDAMKLMSEHDEGKLIRYLPVVDHELLKGVVSIGDIIDALLNEKKFENRLLKNYIKNWPEEEHEV